MKIILIGCSLIMSMLCNAQTKGSITTLENRAIESGVNLKIVEATPEESFKLYNKHDTVEIPEKKVLVADETWFVVAGNSEFRIICTNKQIQDMTISRFRDDIRRFIGKPKYDKNGDFYWEISYYFERSKATVVSNYYLLLDKVKR